MDIDKAPDEHWMGTICTDDPVAVEEALMTLGFSAGFARGRSWNPFDTGCRFSVSKENEADVAISAIESETRLECHIALDTTTGHGAVFDVGASGAYYRILELNDDGFQPRG